MAGALFFGTEPGCWSSFLSLLSCNARVGPCKNFPSDENCRGLWCWGGYIHHYDHHTLGGVLRATGLSSQKKPLEGCSKQRPPAMEMFLTQKLPQARGVLGNSVLLLAPLCHCLLSDHFDPLYGSVLILLSSLLLCFIWGLPMGLCFSLPWISGSDHTWRPAPDRHNFALTELFSRVCFLEPLNCRELCLKPLPFNQQTHLKQSLCFHMSNYPRWCLDSSFRGLTPCMGVNVAHFQMYYNFN